MNTEIIYFMISYLIVIFGIMFFFNWWSNGFFFSIIKTKASRGKKVLVINKSPLEFYSSKGWIEGKRFKWYDRETKAKEKNRLSKALDINDREPSPFFRLFGVTCVMIDEATNSFINPRTMVNSGGIDSMNQENLIMWALQKPSEVQNLTIFLIINLVVGVLILFMVGYLVFKVGQLPALINAVKPVVNTITGGNI